jgi:hypothetical protein
MILQKVEKPNVEVKQMEMAPPEPQIAHLSRR